MDRYKTRFLYRATHHALHRICILKSCVSNVVAKAQWTDDTTVAPHSECVNIEPVLTTNFMQKFMQCYPYWEN